MELMSPWTHFVVSEKMVARHVSRVHQELHDIHITDLFFNIFLQRQQWVGNEAVLHFETIPMVLYPGSTPPEFLAPCGAAWLFSFAGSSLKA